MPDEGPQLYQVVGAALRDVAQARFMSDLFSRQISYTYEQDSLLRRFPVPRVEVDEVEITMQFAITEVSVDPGRHTSRNSAIGSLFGQYSFDMVREFLSLLREKLPAKGTPERAALADVENQVFSDQTLERLSGRLLQYFNENADDIVDSEGKLKSAAVIESLGNQTLSLLTQPEIAPLKEALTDKWDAIVAQAKAALPAKVAQLAEDVAALANRYPDFKLVVQVDAAALQSTPQPLSSVRIRSHVKNYTWTKVDVDDADMRHIRTLTPE